MIIDDQSPPGSWAREMAKAPWAYGQRKPDTVDEILVMLRQRGMEREADILRREFNRLQIEAKR